jgi:hypothetical protein
VVRVQRYKELFEQPKFAPMKVVELIKFSGEMLKRLHDFGIKIDDYQYVNLLNDYEKMKGEGNKQTYALPWA